MEDFDFNNKFLALNEKVEGIPRGLIQTNPIIEANNQKNNQFVYRVLLVWILFEIILYTWCLLLFY